MASKTIRVTVRIRPPNSRETSENANCEVLTIDSSQRVVSVEGTNETFTFHHVFPPKSTQEEVFNVYAKDGVEKALEGFHGILFAYGQTGSGKTHTLSGSPAGEPGVLQRCLQMIWERKVTDIANLYSFQVSYVELYNEVFTDLLCPDGGDPGLTMHQADDVTLTRSNGEEIGQDVSTIEDALQCFEKGASRKSMAETGMNERSSRSHTIFTVYISKQPKAGGECVNGRLILCDLAGSERQGKTKAAGQRMEEAKFINTSLMQLGIVVKQMAEKKSAPSFRNSKLTQMLRYSLSGRGCTSIMVNVSPAAFNKSESLGSMRFGQCAITIKQEPEKHIDLDYKTLCDRLKKQVSELESRLQNRDQAAISMLEEEYERRVKELRAEFETGKDYTNIVHMAEVVPTPQNGSPPPDDLTKYLNVIKILKSRLEQKERDLQQSQHDLIAVTHERDSERERALLLARVLRDKEREFAVRESNLQERVDHLRAEVENQCDLTSTEVTAEDDSMADAMAAVFASKGNLSPRGKDGGENVSEVSRVHEELGRAQRCISVLRDQRVALRVQLTMAKGAIRLLHEQKVALEARLENKY
jgi:hypothetical protein